jgi:DHA1 family bicyclomycin/chloramphenicol resistance-like MFS transporter
VMCARAIVRDLHHPAEGARVMSKAQTGLGVIACLCAPLGGLLSDWFNWRAAMFTMTLFAGGTLAMVALRFQETVTQRNPQALQPATLLTTWRVIVRHPTFWAFSTLSVSTYGGLFTFLAASSFIFIKVLNVSKMGYGLLMFSMTFVYIFGTLACRWLLPRLGVRRAVAVAAAFSLAGGTLMGVLVLSGVHSVWAIMLPYYLYILAHGVHQPCSQSGAVGPFPYAAGAAAALNGFLMMVVAFAMGGWLGTHMDGTVEQMVYGIWFWSVLIALSAWTLVQRHGKTSEH